MRKERLLNAALALGLGLWLVVSVWMSGIGYSADLRATWLAGVFQAQGALDQVYPADTAAFTMHPPAGWIPYMLAQGYDGPVYPYL